MSEKAECVMITGATGVLGQETLKVLTTKFKDLKVKVLVHEETEKKADALLANFKSVEKVVSRPGIVEDPASFRGVHSLLVIPPPVESRVEIVRNILKAAREGGVRFLVTPSHLSVREKDTVLAKTFKEIENEVKKSGLPHCFLHSEVFMDSVLHDAESIKKSGVFSCCIDPDARYNPIAAQDLGELAANILCHPGDHEDTHYTITGPAPLSMTEVAETFSKLLKKEVKYVKQSDAECVKDLQELGNSLWFAKAMSELKRNISGEAEDYTSGDFAKLLDRQPISFARFLEEHKSLFV